LLFLRRLWRRMAVAAMLREPCRAMLATVACAAAWMAVGGWMAAALMPGHNRAEMPQVRCKATPPTLDSSRDSKSSKINKSSKIKKARRVKKVVGADAWENQDVVPVMATRITRSKLVRSASPSLIARNVSSENIFLIRNDLSLNSFFRTFTPA